MCGVSSITMSVWLMLSSLLEKVSGVRLRRFFRRLAIIQFFFFPASGDPMIFHPGEFSLSARDWPQMFHRKIETSVTIKFAIGGIARITLVRAPDLPAGVAIARKHRWARGRKARRIDGAAWAGLPEHEAMRIDDEPAQVGFLQNRFKTRRIGAFRQPATGGGTAENPAMLRHSDRQLQPNTLVPGQ